MNIKSKYFRTDKSLAEYFNKRTATCALISVCPIGKYLCAIYSEYEGE